MYTIYVLVDTKNNSKIFYATDLEDLFIFIQSNSENLSICYQDNMEIRQLDFIFKLNDKNGEMISYRCKPLPFKLKGIKIENYEESEIKA